MDKGDDERSGTGRVRIHVMSTEITNRVSDSGLIEINLEEYYPQGERVVFDMKDHLFQGLVLKEKDFREFVKNEAWNKYKDKYVAILCSADAIVPTWAYMLVAIALESYAKGFVFGDLKTLETSLFLNVIAKIDPEKYRDKKIVVKGCGDVPVPESAYVELTRVLTPVVQSLMFGEPCSTVPLMKRSVQK